MNILKWLLGGRKLVSVPQTGVLPEPDITKLWRTGGPSSFPTDVLLSNGKWKLYRGSSEAQSIVFKFDTMSCTSFSADHVVGYIINWLRINTDMNDEIMDFLQDNGYFDDKGFNCSDRFTAIMSNTTRDGNYFSAVWDSIRHNGLIPEKMFPFDGKTWDQYHDKSKITPEMIALGKKFAEYFEVFYELIINDDDPTLSPVQKKLLQEGLKQSPIHIGTPVPANHAIVLESLDEEGQTLTVFDQYPPFEFINKIEYPVHYGFKAAIVPKLKPESAVFVTLKKGMRTDDVKVLQEDLKKLGYFVGTTTTLFGTKTLAAVKAFQKAEKLTADGIVGPITRAKITECLKKKSVSQKGIATIKGFEGFRANSYKDSGGIWTIGYGSLRDAQGNRVTKSTHTVTEYQATQLLMRDVKDFENSVNNLVTCNLTQNQFDAIVSLVYNIGATNFKKSALLRNLNSLKPVTKLNFTAWNKADGKVIKGLTARREKEYELFML